MGNKQEPVIKLQYDHVDAFCGQMNFECTGNGLSDWRDSYAKLTFNFPGGRFETSMPDEDTIVLECKGDSELKMLRNSLKLAYQAIEVAIGEK